MRHSTSADGTQVEVSLGVNMQAPDGLSQQVVHTVSENGQTFRVWNCRFDEEGRGYDKEQLRWSIHCF
jgi:hypothetical protein